MLNPSYLLQSRHHIYYFRYPIPSLSRVKGKATHIQMSLDTRCPKEALRLAGVLEYHTAEILKHLQATGMEYSEIVKRVRDYWSEILTRRKAGIDQSGLLSPSKISLYQREIENAEDMIANNWPEDELAYTDGSIITPTQHLLNRLGLSIPESDPSYDQFKKEGYYGMAWFFRELLKYNDTYRDSIYGNQAINPQVIEVTAGQANDKQSPLKEAVHEYLQNIKGDDLASRTLEEREDQLNLLMEILGEGYNLFSLDIRQAAKVKEILRVIPKNRSKNKDIRDLSLQQQLQVSDVERLSVGSINKYLACYGAFLKWGHIHGLSNPNSFEGMALKDSRGKKKRDSFQLSQVTMMLEELAKRENGLANQEYQYWGALLLLYTGARLNEIASLTVDDIKENAGIWYFDINDEEEEKSLKTEAAKRIVPVHSDLIELGFLDFLQKAKESRKQNERLLHELSFAPRTKWGRMLGRWFNDKFLEKLGIKTERLVLHSLRHTVITMLQEADVDIPKIQRLVGHEPDTVTMGVYGSRYTLPQLKEAIECLKYKDTP